MDTNYCKRCGSGRLENETHCFECIDILEDARQRGEVEAERDRLAAENAQLRELLEIEQATAHDAAELSAAWANAAGEANATLGALREAVPEGDDIYGWSERAYLKLLLDIQRILYPQLKETTDDER